MLLAMDRFRTLADVLRWSDEKMAKCSIFSSERFFFDVYAFEPGQSQKSHRHAGSDKVYFVLEGEGTFRVDGDERRVGPGGAVHCPAGSEHGVANAGPARLAVLVWMAPPP